jgi:hypothetical protein
MTAFPSPRTTSTMTPRPFARHSVGRNTWPDKNVYLDRRAFIPIALGIVFRLCEPSFFEWRGNIQRQNGVYSLLPHNTLRSLK